MDYKKLTKIIDSFASNEVEGPWNGDTGFYDYITNLMGEEAAQNLFKTGKDEGTSEYEDEETGETWSSAYCVTLPEFYEDYQKKLKEDKESPYTPWSADDDPEDDIDSSEKEDRISELSRRLDQLRIDMENDPEVLAEHGNGGPASDRYGEQMNEIEAEINELSNI